MSLKKLSLIALILSFSFTLIACSPEVGSKEWCVNMKEEPKGDWSMNDAGDFAKFCILR